ncbi:MAG TPA: hypothetical protein VED40_04725 [Azospirillaceae bacterium]|nr:hypothetical protein [Azospirillaceae bacterium]
MPDGERTHPLPPLHRYVLDENGVTDAETLKLARDRAAVLRSVHQSMPVDGPWVERRVAAMIRSWLPPGVQVSMNAQLADPDRPKLRSCSWDIIIHDPVGPEWGCPPPPDMMAGFPLVPTPLAYAAIDTKGFLDPGGAREYVAGRAFNHLNDCTLPQLDILHPTVIPILLVMATSGAAATLEAAVKESLKLFCLGKVQATPVADGESRVITWTLVGGHGADLPLQRLRRTIMRAMEQRTENQEIAHA